MDIKAVVDKKKVVSKDLFEITAKPKVEKVSKSLLTAQRQALLGQVAEIDRKLKAIGGVK